MEQTCALIAPVQPILHRVSCTNETLTNPTKHYETHEYKSLGSNGVDRVRSLPKIPIRVRGTNFCINCTIWAFFAPSYKRQRNCPKCTREYEMHQNISLGSNGVDRVRSVRKILTRLHSRTFALVQPVLHRDSYGNQTVQNAPKLYEMHPNISLGSHGVDRVRSVWKIPTRLRCMDFCTSSARFAPIIVRQPNGPKYTQIE